MGMGSFALNPINAPELDDAIVLGSRVMRYLPFSGLLSRWLGLQGVDPKNFKRLLSLGKNLIINPGGFECATYTNNKQDTTYIKSRKGFIKYALEYGYNVHPCYVFNENKTYNTINGFEKFGLFLNKYKIPGCFYYGKLFLLPKEEVDLTIAISSAIKFPKITNPSTDDIQKYNNIYIETLQSLYKKYQASCGGSETLILH